MTPIKQLLNNVLEMKSDKHNLNQGTHFLNNKKRFAGFNKAIEGFECSIPNTDDKELAKSYDIANIDAKNLNHDGPLDVTIDCNAGYEGTPIVTPCDGEGQPIKLSGCKPSISTLIKEKSAEYTKVLKEYSDSTKKYHNKKDYNVKDKNGNVYYRNFDGDYYQYINNAGDNTFKPRHINFNSSCPKTAPKFKKNPPYVVSGKVDPISEVDGINTCIKYKNEQLNLKDAELLQIQRELNDLLEKQRRESSDDAGGALFKRNRAAIVLSDKINKYNKLVEKSKKISDNIKSFDTSRSDFLKSITALQIQYGVIGISSLALLYLTIKMMSKSQS